MEPLKIKVGPSEWPVIIPPEFSMREELVAAWGACPDDDFMRLRRVAAAAIGLCTRVGTLAKRANAKADYVKADYNVLTYGGQMWDYMHSQGVPIAEVITSGIAILSALAEEYAPPKAAEVKEREVFSGAAAGSSTPS